MKIWIVGWAQDLDDWGVHSVWANEDDANRAADELRDALHTKIRRDPVYQDSKYWPRTLQGAHERRHWMCCRPQIVESELELPQTG